MPSKTAKQARFMAACAHGAGYKSCPPASVAKEFNAADAQSGILRNNKRSVRSSFHKRSTKG
jgi:hypothetical protein